MAYAWTNETLQWGRARVVMTIGDGSLTVDVTAQDSSEGATKEQFEVLMGSVRDACLAAGLTVGQVLLSGTAIAELQEVP